MLDCSIPSLLFDRTIISLLVGSNPGFFISFVRSLYFNYLSISLSLYERFSLGSNHILTMIVGFYPGSIPSLLVY